MKFDCVARQIGRSQACYSDDLEAACTCRSSIYEPNVVTEFLSPITGLAYYINNEISDV